MRVSLRSFAAWVRISDARRIDTNTNRPGFPGRFCVRVICGCAIVSRILPGSRILCVRGGCARYSFDFARFCNIAQEIA